MLKSKPEAGLFRRGGILNSSLKTLLMNIFVKKSNGVHISTIDLKAKEIPVSGLSVRMRQRPIVAYFTLAFAGTWALQMPMVLGTNGLGLFLYEVPMALFAILFILSVYAGPTMSAFLVTNALDGKESRRKLFRRYGQWRVGLLWYALAIFGFPIIYLIAGSIALGSVPLSDLRANWTTFFSPYLFGLLIFPALLTWGEEPGWRGFALTDAVFVTNNGPGAASNVQLTDTLPANVQFVSAALSRAI